MAEKGVEEQVLAMERLRSLYGFPLRKGMKLQIRTSTSEWKNGILRYNQDADKWYLEGVNCSVLEGLIVRTEEII